MISIVDYGWGNVGAFERLCRLNDLAHERLSDPDSVASARRIVLPGVGAIDTVMNSLEASGLRDAITAAMRTGNARLLGVCVGMHALARSSSEGSARCFSFVDGLVERFDPFDIEIASKIPHMGWNSIELESTQHPLLDGIDLHRGFYFLHSYRFVNTAREAVIATADHGGRFPAIVGSGNAYGVQFHPEKSHDNGVRLIDNFARIPLC